jgi:hypothetical protein
MPHALCVGDRSASETLSKKVGEEVDRIQQHDHPERADRTDDHAASADMAGSHRLRRGRLRAWMWVSVFMIRPEWLIG